MELTCFECQTKIEAEDEEGLREDFLAHARSSHEWPFPDMGIRNFASATIRLSPVRERVEAIGNVEVHRVTEDRIDDWLRFFDKEAFAGKPEWASCYCLEPHEYDPKSEPSEEEFGTWRERRERMSRLLRDGTSYGYLAYADGEPAAWVNASLRKDYALYRQEDDEDPATIGVSCFIVAPPYRRHGLAATLLDRVLADAPARGAKWVEAYPFLEDSDDDAGKFRGPRSLYDERGFTEVTVRQRDAVVRRPV